MKRRVLMIVGLTTVFFAGASYSQSRGPCDQLTNPTAKRNCLQRDLDWKTKQAAAARERMERLNKQAKIACDATSFMDRVAWEATKIGLKEGNTRLFYGGLTWTSMRAISSRLAREKQNCASARQAVERERSR